MSTTAPKASFYQSPNQVPTNRPLMPWGTFWGTPDLVQKSGKNSPPQASETWTIAVPGTVEDAASYYVSEGGVQAVHLTAGTGQDDLGNGLVDSIGSTLGSSSAGGTLSSRWNSVYDASANLLTLTATWPGVVTGTWTVSSGFTNDLGAPSKIVDAAFAARVKAGRALVSMGSMPGTVAGTRLVFQPIASDFDAQVIGITIAGAAGATFTPQLTFNGQAVTGDAVVWVTSDTVTALAILTEINTLMDANFVAGASVVATQTAGLVTLTAEVAGATFDANIIAAGAASSATKDLTTGPSLATSFERAFVGISERGTDVEAISNDSDVGCYGPNEGVRYVTRGIGTVERAVGETWALGDGLWIDVSAANREDSAKLHNVAAAGRIWVSTRTLVVDQGGGPESTTTGVIRLHMGA